VLPLSSTTIWAARRADSRQRLKLSASFNVRTTTLTGGSSGGERRVCSIVFTFSLIWERQTEQNK